MLRVLDSVGDSLAEDGGPDAADLRREMRYLWEDAVDGVAEPGSGGQGQAVPQWRPVRWDELSSLLAASPLWRRGPSESADPSMASFTEVRLRVSPAELRAMWERRVLEREPLQYVTSSADWRDLCVAVGPGVLIPRPETEIMIDLAEEFLATPSGSGNAAHRPWADLGE